MYGVAIDILQVKWDPEAEQMVMLVKQLDDGKEWTLTYSVLRAVVGRDEFYRPPTRVEEARELRTETVEQPTEEVHPTHELSMDTRWCDSCNRMIANRNGPTATGVDPCIASRTGNGIQIGDGNIQHNNF
jgi:hypothetical protein